MKVYLIFPPPSDPRGPHLSLPSLAATLRKSGHEVILKDLDLEIVTCLLTPQTLNLSVQRAKEKIDALDRKGKLSWQDSSYRHRLSTCLQQAPFLVNSVRQAVEILQGDEFYQLDKYRFARRIINESLALITASRSPHLFCRMDGQIFQTRFRSDVLADLEEAVTDDTENLFGEWYEHSYIAEVGKEKPDIVGISILNYQQIIPGLTLACKLKQRGFPVFVGGTVYVKFIDEIEKKNGFFNFCDGLVVYEGEQALLKLASEVEFSRVPNLIWKDGKKVKVNRPFQVENLDLLPCPDFDGMPLDDYLVPERVLPYALSKGCYWNRCNFCEIPYINNLPGTEYRVRDVRRSVDQLEELSSRYHTPYFQFTDESCSPDLLSELASEIIRRNLQIRFLCYARFDKGFTEKVCKHLYEGGLRKLMFGLESGSPGMLKKMNKGMTVRQSEKIMENCTKAGIYFRLFAIVGFPDETEKEALETFEFFKRNIHYLKSPFNTFEINRFHLDRHSCYNREREKFGIKVHEEYKADFSLGGWKFETEKGMDEKTVNTLLKKMNDELYYLADGEKKYSGWEEYSLLVIDKLASR